MVIWFFSIDLVVLLAFLVAGIGIVGYSVKELADFIIEKIYISFPIVLAMIIVGALLFFCYRKSKLKKLYERGYKEVPFKQVEGYLKLKRICTVFIINTPLVIISFLEGLGVVAEQISHHGFLGFIGGVLFGFLALIAWVAICGLALWAFHIENEYGKDFENKLITLISVGIFVLQAILTVFIALG